MKKKTILITGGGSGIGQAVSHQLAQNGWQVFIVGRNQEKLTQSAAAYPQNITSIQADLENLESYQMIAEKINTPHLDCLIHNAAITDPMQSINTVDLIEFEKIMRINVTACLGLTQALLPKLEDSRVLFISSGAAMQPLYEWSPYCISKAALKMLKMCFQSELRKIAFADVRPGVVDTPMVQHIMEGSFKGVDRFRALSEKNKLIAPETVGQFLVWILTETSLSDYQKKSWDIYEPWHYPYWLKEGDVPALM